MMRVLSEKPLVIGVQEKHSPAVPSQRVTWETMAVIAGHGIPEGLVHPLRDQHGVARLQAGTQELHDVGAVQIAQGCDLPQECLPLACVQVVVQPLDGHDRHTVLQGSEDLQHANSGIRAQVARNYQDIRKVSADSVQPLQAW